MINVSDSDRYHYKMSKQGDKDSKATPQPIEDETEDPVLAADPATSAALGLLDEDEEMLSEHEALDDAFIQEDEQLADETLSVDPAVLGHGQPLAGSADTALDEDEPVAKKAKRPPKDALWQCPRCPEKFTKKAISRHMKIVHDQKGWHWSMHPDRKAKDELVQTRLARQALEKEAKDNVEELQSERNHLLNRIREIDEQRERMLKTLQTEQDALMGAVLIKDDLIDLRTREAEAQLHKLATREGQIQAGLKQDGKEGQEPDVTNLVRVDVGPLLDIQLDIPSKLHLDNYRPAVSIPEQQWSSIPEVVSDTILGVLGPEVPINASMPYAYLQAGLLPHFVVAYFMTIQKPKKTMRYSTVFGRAMHLIEEFREWRLHQAGAFDDPETSIGPQEQDSGQAQTEESRVTPDPAAAEDNAG